jgi:L-seryl-tRNA(Ser) seleniumtransferase
MACRAPARTTVRESLAAGANLVVFSGDKLLGGPQAGSWSGARIWSPRLAAHPLMRRFVWTR